MVQKDLEKLLFPQSIAVIGASRSKDKLGHIVLKNIIESGFKGYLYPVNPKTNEVLKLKSFPDLNSIPLVPDLVIIAIPSDFVLEVMHEIVHKGVKNVVVLTAGFKEIGEEGFQKEKDLIQIAQDNNINLLGPNCLGFVNNLHNLNATFGMQLSHIGNLRFISQSGAIASSMFDYGEQAGLGFSEFITLGNKSCLSENDILLHWHKADNLLPFDKKHEIYNKNLSSTKPIGLYLESLQFGEEFINLASQITLEHPMFILKPGKSEQAQKAMQSHTGSIAGEDYVLDQALEQAGVIRCEGIEDLFDLAKAFAWENAPEGPNIAIISNAGGPAVATADFVEKSGLKLATITQRTEEVLREKLPRAASLQNPIDVLGDALALRYAAALDAVLAQSNVNAVVVILTPQVMTEISLTAEFIVRLAKTHGKPVFCSFTGGRLIAEGEKILNMHKIPSYLFPERAIKALGAMWKWKSSIEDRKLRITSIKEKSSLVPTHDFDEEKLTLLLSKIINSNRKVLNNIESNNLLTYAEVKTPPTAELPIGNVNKIEALALKFTQTYGWPIVLKLSSEHILHKSDLGGVIVNINNRSKLKSALKELTVRIKKLNEEIQKTIKIQIQKQVVGGRELILGIKRDVSFGHVMMFGAGGTLAEIIKDRNLHLLPVGSLEAQILVANSKIYKILKGYRGEKSYALDKLYFLIEKLSDFVQRFPEIEQIEINPVIITQDEVWAVDGKVILQ